MKRRYSRFLSTRSAWCVTTGIILACVAADAAEKKSRDQSPAKTKSQASETFPVKYQATDDRVIVIGQRKPAEGGWSFKNPHMENCWIADGFNFQGYDTLYIAPTLSTAKLADDAGPVHEFAKENLVTELSRSFSSNSIFSHIVTRESDIKPGARVLKMENTITKYSKGGGAARFWAGEFGAGQPVLQVVSKITQGDKVVANCELRRSGASARSRMLGGTMKDEDVQIRDIRSLALDYSDFAAAVTGKYQPRK